MTSHPYTARRPGQALPLLALTLLLLIAFSALAVDGALAFSWRRNVVNATDSAALVAVRALITARAGGSADDINDAVSDYLASELNTETPDFSVFYVDAAGRPMPTANPTPISGATRPPSASRGVRVEVRHTHETYLMALFGQPTLTVSAASTARFGNSGTIVGMNLVPLGVNQTGAAVIRDPANRAAGVRIDLSGWIAEHNQQLQLQWAGDAAYTPGTDPPYPAWVDPRTFVRQDQTRSVRLRHGYAQPELGSRARCSSITTPEDTLQSWWCSGTPHQMHVGDPFANSWNALERDLVGVAPVDDSLIAHEWMGSRHNTVIILPVYVDVASRPAGTPIGAGDLYVIDHFIAVRLQALNYAQGWVRVEYLDTFTTAGGLVGTNNNVDRGNPCEVCAVNLVREAP